MTDSDPRVTVWTHTPVLPISTSLEYTFLIPEREHDQLFKGVDRGLGGGLMKVAECTWFQAPDEKILRRVVFEDDAPGQGRVQEMGSMAWAVEYVDVDAIQVRREILGIQQAEGGSEALVVVEGPVIETLFGPGALVLVTEEEAQRVLKRTFRQDVYWQDVEKVCARTFVVATVKNRPGMRVALRGA